MSMPTINVNVGATHAHPNTSDPSFCDSDCASILIPLPLDRWRSVPFTVRIGDCACPRSIALRAPSNTEVHRNDCPARPIRVSCSISGKDWASSEVTEIAVTGGGRDREPTNEDMAALHEACRDRWALVKALVLGFDVRDPRAPSVPTALSSQRDAVFAAIADMAKNEEAGLATKQRLCKACPEIFPKSGVTVPEPEKRESAAFLAACVESLIEQVGALP